MSIIESAARKLHDLTDLHIVGPEIFRGDSWQLLLSPSNYALHAAFYIRAALKSGGRADTRIGDVQTLGSVLGPSDGPAFRLSGKALDGLKKSETLACLAAPAHFTNAQTKSLLNASPELWHGDRSDAFDAVDMGSLIACPTEIRILSPSAFSSLRLYWNTTSSYASLTLYNTSMKESLRCMQIVCL